MSVAHHLEAHHLESEHNGWTVDEVLALPEDRSQRVELVWGSLLMSPSPAPPHQMASRRLANALEAAAADAEAPLVAHEAVNVVVPGGLLIPDVALVDLTAAEEVFTSGEAAFAAEAVALVVEVASPYNRRVDVELKSKLYAEAKIPSYWRLDLRPAPSLVISELEGGTYVERMVAPPGQQSTWQRPFPVTLDPAELLRLR